MTKKELEELKIEAYDKAIYDKIQKNFDSIAKPIDGLGDFEKIICKIGACIRDEKVDISNKALVIMCSDNGVVVNGVSQTDKSVTKAVAALMGENKSSVCIMAKNLGLNIKVVDIGIDTDEKLYNLIDKKVAKGTKDILVDNAMSEEECMQAINAGIDIVKQCKEEGVKIIATGEMGIGNTTTSTACLAALTAVKVDKIVGRGAGLTDEAFSLKQAVIEGALRFHDYGIRKANDFLSAFDALKDLGGFDIAGLTGVFIGGAIYHIPVVIDGVISAVAALFAERLVNGSSSYMIPSHSGREQGTLIALNELSLKPFINGNMALGEGTGAIMIYPLLDMVLNLYNQGIDFGDTNISQYERYEAKS